MRSDLRLLPFLLCILASTSSGVAQNLEGGIHGGFSLLGREPSVSPLGREKGTELGVWVILWPKSRFALAADWSYIPRPDFETLLDSSTVGESRRNRQYVDLTLQYHVPVSDGARFFVQAGGGRQWNNRDVINPSGVPSFEEHGYESTPSGVWTLGAGFRHEIVRHVHWIVELKAHSPRRAERDGWRAFTGITFSLR